VTIGEGTKIHVDECTIFGDCVIGKNCKIQNNVIIGPGIIIEDGVFIGPGVTFTNDKTPRSINPDGSLKDGSDWKCERTVVQRGAAIGAGAVIGPGVVIERFAMVCAGSVVLKSVPPFAKVMGNPARLLGLADDAEEYVRGELNELGADFGRGSQARLQHLVQLRFGVDLDGYMLATERQFLAAVLKELANFRRFGSC